METNPYEGTLHGGLPPDLQKPSLMPKVWGCLGIFCILAVWVALLLPMRRSAGPSAYRMMCGNNLKQIGLALHLYAEQYGSLPPAHTIDAEGKPLHSWRTLILPFMEQEPLYNRIDLSKPWDDPANKVAFAAATPGYMCPSVNCPDTHTVYMAVAVPGGCFKPTESRKLSEITDSHSSTLMVIEVDEKQAVHWMSPTDSVDLTFPRPDKGASLPHQRGFQAAFVDFSVHYLRGDIKPETIRALITIDGKDEPGEY